MNTWTKTSIARSAIRQVVPRGLRTERGEGLIGGIAGTFLFIAIALPVGIFFINASIQLIVQSQLAHIANQAAIVVREHGTWLGQPRPDFDSATAESKAESAARAMCAAIGLPPVRVDAEFDKPTDDPEIHLSTVDLTVDVTRKIPFRLSFFGYDFGKLFPTSLSARGVAVQSHVKPYALMHLEAPSTAAGDQRASNRSGVYANARQTAVVPIFAYGEKTVAGQPDTIQTYFFGNGFDLHANNVASFNTYYLFKEDNEALANGNLKQLKLAGWHPNFIVNGHVQPGNDPPGVGLTP